MSEDISDDLESKVDQIIEEKRAEMREEIVKELKEEENISDDNPNNSSGISRRKFLKKAGLGMAGVGALSLTPSTAGLTLSKNGIFGSDSQNQSIRNVEELNASFVNESEKRYTGVASSAAGDVTISGDFAWNEFRIDGSTLDDGAFSSINNSNAFQIDEPGFYILVGTARWKSDSGWSTGDKIETRFQFAKPDGTSLGSVPSITGKISDIDQTTYCFAFYELNEGDEPIECFFECRQNSGSNKQIEADSAAQRTGVIAYRV